MPDSTTNRKLKAAERARRYRERQPGYVPRSQSKAVILRDLGVPRSSYYAEKARQRQAEARSSEAWTDSYAHTDPVAPYGVPTREQHADTMLGLIRNAPQALAEFAEIDPIGWARH